MITVIALWFGIILFLIGFGIFNSLGLAKAYIIGVGISLSLLCFAVVMSGVRDAQRKKAEKRAFAAMSPFEQEYWSFVELCRSLYPGKPDPTRDEFRKVVKQTLRR
jgi:hypothetical protein